LPLVNVVQIDLLAVKKYCVSHHTHTPHTRHARTRRARAHTHR
jgi:hypothetical protein